MKKFFLIAAIVIPIFAAKAQTFTLQSHDLGGQATKEQTYNSFGCTGDNISPHLMWKNAPTDTKSFAVTIHDESAPTSSGWWHWLVFNIPADVNELKSGFGDISKKLDPQQAIQSITDFGSYGYGGPCPPEGDRPHKYSVTVYALRVDKLELDKNTNPAYVGFALEQNMIEKASLVFYLKR